MKYKFVELTTVEGDLCVMITDSLNEDRKDGWNLEDVKYSTTFDSAFNKTRSCAMIIMYKEEGADE